MINLKINYSLESEVLRVQDALERIDWFKEKGYKLRLPGSLSLDYSDFKNPEYIKKAVADEYGEENYKEEEKYILDNLSKINTILEKFFTLSSIKPQNSYEINLTKYGVGGSYHLPHKIIANIQVLGKMKLVRTIIHEIMHLSTEKWIQEHNIGHWEKERIIDLTFEKIAPEINAMQKLPINTQAIDEIFERYYPNIEEIIKNIK